MGRAWMPLYVGDYLRDTRDLNTLQHGAYLLLIMHYWQHDALPSDDARLAAITGLSVAQWRRIREPVQAKFSDGWRHKRIEAEIAKTDRALMQRRAAGRNGGVKSGIARAVAQGEAIIRAQAEGKRALRRNPSGPAASDPAGGKQPRTNHNHRFESSSAAREGPERAKAPESRRITQPQSPPINGRGRSSTPCSRAAASMRRRARTRQQATRPPTRKPENSRHGTAWTQAQNRASASGWRAGARAIRYPRAGDPAAASGVAAGREAHGPEGREPARLPQSPGRAHRRAIFGGRALRGRGRQIPRRHRDAERHLGYRPRLRLPGRSQLRAHWARRANAGGARSATMRPSRPCSSPASAPPARSRAWRCTASHARAARSPTSSAASRPWPSISAVQARASAQTDLPLSASSGSCASSGGGRPKMRLNISSVQSITQ